MGRACVLRLAAFTEDPAGGNPADERAMRRIAGEVGYSETAFVLAQDGDTLTVRYFSGGTPSVEVPFCGHATIATAVACARAWRRCPTTTSPPCLALGTLARQRVWRNG